MKGLAEEISDVPFAARQALEAHQGLQLPLNVPYIGMGSSFYGPLALQYCGREITAHMASEYYGYLSLGRSRKGVLLSQSGESSETLWCRDLFDEYVAVVNVADSPLAAHPKVTQVVELHAGEEEFSSTKTFINTLVVLQLGFGIDPTAAVERIERDYNMFRDEVQYQADEIARRFDAGDVSGAYVVGSGPNVAVAGQGALVLSETLKRAWIDMPIGQYDHGPKETADGSIVILLDGQGRERKRISAVRNMLRDYSNALVIDMVEDEVGETLSPIPLIARINLLMNALADRLDVTKTFSIGGKVTHVAEGDRPTGAEGDRPTG